MAWSDPITWVFKTTILSATLLNREIRDNMSYLKNKPMTVVDLGAAADQTGISTTWVKVTGSDLAITVFGTGSLAFTINLLLKSTTAGARFNVDIFDVNTFTYLSSGTLTPRTNGLGQVDGGTTLGMSMLMTYILEGVSEGEYNYEIHIKSSHASGTIDNTLTRNQVSVREL